MRGTTRWLTLCGALLCCRGGGGDSATPAQYTQSTPRHGFVSRALICRDAGGEPSGCR